MLDKTTVREIAGRYADEVKKHLNPTAVLIFGSYINGTPHEWSDIDIAVIVRDFKGDRLKTAALLSRLTRLVSIDIEPHLLDDAYDKSGFAEHVMQTGEYIFKTI